MAFQVGNNRSLMSEINVTPLVDVMLVLLIIFMVTAPMMTEGMDVKLPQVDAGAMRTEGEQVVITLNAQGEVFIDEVKTTMDDLGLKVKRVMEVQNTDQVYLRADKNIPYGQVAQLMGLVTEPEQVIQPEKPEKPQS